MQARHVALLALAWAVYGCTSFVGGLVASRHTSLSPLLILYWMLLGRTAGTVLAAVCACVYTQTTTTTRGLTHLTRWHFIAPSILPLIGNVGWVSYFVLSRSQNVSVLMPLLSIYIVIPLAYSLVSRRETCSVPKILGCGMVLATGVLLGLEVTTGKPSDSAPSSAYEPWVVGVLFTTTLLAWGLSDTISSSVPKGNVTLPMLLGFNAMGYVANTAVMGAVVHFAHIQPATVDALWVWAGVNALYPVGWGAYTHLCRSHDGVVIVPLFGMYILVPAIGGLVFAGDPATPFTVAGVLCGACASVLLAWKGGSSTTNPSPTSTFTPTPVQVHVTNSTISANL